MNIGNDNCGAMLMEGARTEFVGKNKLLRGRVGHVLQILPWSATGPQLAEWIDVDGKFYVVCQNHLRRIKSE